MKQVASIISIYAADISGVASSLFELGGMTVMHDASGCNTTYTTHDEPRWYDVDSMVFISGMTEIDAIIGDDHRLINDIKLAALELSPRFIAIAGTPIPMMIGTDFNAIAKIIERETGIPCFGINTNSMHCYFHGASQAFKKLAERFVKDPSKRKNINKIICEEKNPIDIKVNIMGLTPLDFSVNGTDISIRNYLEDNGFKVIGSWAMGSSFNDIENAASADVNLVVSSAGLEVADFLYEKFSIPYVVGLPVGKYGKEKILQDLQNTLKTGKNIIAYMNDTEEGKNLQKKHLGNFKNSKDTKSLLNSVNKNNYDESDLILTNSPLVTLIGEQVINASIAESLAREEGITTQVISPLDTPTSLLRNDDLRAEDETEIIPHIKQSKVIIADPLYRFIVPEKASFVPYPHEAFSGRIYRRDIPDIVKDDILLKKIIDELS